MKTAKQLFKHLHQLKDRFDHVKEKGSGSLADYQMQVLIDAVPTLAVLSSGAISTPLNVGCSSCIREAFDTAASWYERNAKDPEVAGDLLAGDDEVKDVNVAAYDSKDLNVIVITKDQADFIAGKPIDEVLEFLQKLTKAAGVQPVGDYIPEITADNIEPIILASSRYLFGLDDEDLAKDIFDKVNEVLEVEFPEKFRGFEELPSLLDDGEQSGMLSGGDLQESYTGVKQEPERTDASPQPDANLTNLETQTEASPAAPIVDQPTTETPKKIATTAKVNPAKAATTAKSATKK